jgi:hypothetical protein
MATIFMITQTSGQTGLTTAHRASHRPNRFQNHWKNWRTAFSI